MSARVSSDDLEMAATWLDLNEGRNGESESCKRVAEMLRAQIAKRNTEAVVRGVIKDSNLKAAQVRAKMKEKGL